MEVHHHPNVEKKNLKEYFLEFLMIFLAVTMGFFAEQIRENFTERNKEKEYMGSFVKDLKMDTAMLNAGFPRKEGRIKAIDSVFVFLPRTLMPDPFQGNCSGQSEGPPLIPGLSGTISR